MGYRPSNRARKLISRNAGISKHGFPKDRTVPHIFINSTITSGTVGTIGRQHEMELTLDEAIALQKDLSRVIEDVTYHLRRSDGS